jgi:hypothetical protein
MTLETGRGAASVEQSLCQRHGSNAEHGVTTLRCTAVTGLQSGELVAIWGTKREELAIGPGLVHGSCERTPRQ